MNRSNMSKQVDPRSKMQKPTSATSAKASGMAKAAKQGKAGMKKAMQTRNAKASGRGFAKGGSVPKGCGIAKRGKGKVRMM